MQSLSMVGVSDVVTQNVVAVPCAAEITADQREQVL
jgi:hypothetical protein